MSEEFNKYEEHTFDSDEWAMDVIKINPSFYIHKCLLGCQQALMNEEKSLAQFQYIHNVNLLECLILSANLIDEEEYNKEVKEKAQKEKLGNIEELNSIQQMRFCMLKFKILSNVVFHKQDVIAPLKASK